MGRLRFALTLISTTIVVAASPAFGQGRFSSSGLIYSAQSGGGPIAVDGAGRIFAVEAQSSVDASTTSPSMFVTELSADARTVLKRIPIGHGVAAAITVDTDGNVYVAGSTRREEFSATAAFGVSTTEAAAFVVKIDSSGRLLYSVVVGGAYAAASGVAVDASGNVYLAGVASGDDFPTTPGAFDRTFHGGTDATHPSDGFVLKLNGAGTSLLYSMYLGGAGDDTPAGIAVDAAGNAYVAGTTRSNDYPVTSGAYQITKDGGSDGFVTKVNPTGAALVYSTFLGGVQNDAIRALGLYFGNLYVGGVTLSTNFPTSQYAARQTYSGAGYDGFVTYFDTNGQIKSSTYVGGGKNDEVYGLAVDADETAIVTGATISADYPIAAGAIQNAPQGSEDAFVTKLNQYGGVLYSTYLGSASAQQGLAIAVDQNRDVYISGRTGSNFPYSKNAVVTLAASGDWSPFLVKLVAQQAIPTSATATSQEDASLGPAGATDGDPTTRWSSAFSDPQQLTIDLGKLVILNRIVLDWETAYARGYDVLFSEDAQTWHPIFSTDTGSGGIVDIRHIDGAVGRYVAVYGRERATEWGYSLWGISVFGSVIDVANQPPNVALASPIGSTRYLAPAQVDINVSAIDPDGTIARVDIYVDGYGIARLTAPPYRTTYIASSGTHTIKANAVDNLGATGSTTTIEIYVLSPEDLGPNLALGRPASASSVETPGLEPSHAVDGSDSTRWSSSFSDPQWIAIDLGARYNLDIVVLKWETAAARLFDVQVSDDATLWTTIYNITSGTGGTQVLAVSGAGRYLRVLGRMRATEWGYSLWEIQAYGTPAGSGGSTSNIALTGRAFSSSDEASGLVAALAIDNDRGTRWSSAFADGEWLAVDLGAACDITRVVLRWETAYAARFAIQVSNDASAWRTIIEADGHLAGDDLALTATARYIRMVGLQRATDWGFSLWEFEIYGSLTRWDRNLAKDQPAVASSIEANEFAASRAVDGSATTRWASAWIDNQEIVVGLGGLASLKRVVLKWETAYAKRYRVQVGDNPAGPWRDAYENTHSDGNVDDLSVDATGRYLRVLCEERATTWGCSLWEIEAYGASTPSVGNPSWNILVLIYDGIDFQYVDGSGQSRHVVGEISPTQYTNTVAAATRFVNTDIPALTSHQMVPRLTIRSPGTLTRLSPDGYGGWWPGPWDVTADRDPAFDAVIVIWQTWVVDQATGQRFPINGFAGLTPSMGISQTYMSMIADAATSYGHLNVFKHEFGHSITEYFDAAGTAPKPKVENHAYSGQYVNCNGGAPYVWQDENDANLIPNSIYNDESGFTHDYYSGTTALATDPTRCLGIPPAAWHAGGPVSKY